MGHKSGEYSKYVERYLPLFPPRMFVLLVNFDAVTVNIGWANTDKVPL